MAQIQHLAILLSLITVEGVGRELSTTWIIFRIWVSML
jgi:hypothetical protein